MTPTYATKLSFVTYKTNVDIQKIESFPLVIYGMVLVGFSIQDKLENIWFFEEIFLLTDCKKSSAYNKQR